MCRAAAAARVAALVLGIALVVGMPAAAHDCSSQSDCEQTTGYITGISVIGGIIAIITGILGTQLGGAVGGTVAGGAGGAVGGSVAGGTGTAEPPATDDTQVVPEDFPGPLAPGQVRPEELPPAPEEPPAAGGGGDAPEVPWDKLIGATEPPEGGEEGPPIDPIDELLGGEPGGIDLGEPGEEPVDADGRGQDPGAIEEPGDDPIDELLGGGKGGGGDDDPLAGEPGIDDLVPIDELLGPEQPEDGTEPVEVGSGESGTTEEGGEEGPGEKGDKTEKTDTVKPPILEATEKGTEIAGQVKDAADKVKELGEEVGDAVGKAKDLMGALGGEVSEQTRTTVDDTLDKIGDAASGVKDYAEKAGEVAEKVKEYGEKAGEYMTALNENLEKTEKLGLTDDSQNFLGWWRMTFKAAGEVTEKFVEGVTSPVTKLFGEKYGEKAQDLINQAVPVKEFGEELSKLPTSAAEHVVNAQNRDQVAENVNLVPNGDAGYIELDDLYPGRKWP